MKKKFIIIIVVGTMVILSILLGVLYWGLQPVTREAVSLEKLNKKLGARYCMPYELPFDGEVECYIIYVEGHMGVVLTRFEASSKNSTGYLINLKDSKREIYIEAGDLVAIDAEAAEKLTIDHYNDQKIEYIFSETEMDNKLVTLFEINGKTYYISAKYNKDIDSKTLKSDIECILDQMIKQ